jgi:hypothetical protein
MGSLLLLAVLLMGVFVAWTWLTLSWAYSDGERAGVLQKFSRRGVVCKTQEGELALYLMPGVAPKIWEFSVRDPAVAAQLDKAVGSWVQLHYTEHPGVPSSCFADTRYFVDRVNLSNPSPYGTSMPGPGSPAPPTGGPSSQLPAPPAVNPTAPPANSAPRSP